MTGYKIENFKATYGTASADVSAPVSLHKAFGAEDFSSIPEGVSLFATVCADASMLSSRYLYLKITDAPSLSEVRVGGECIYVANEGVYTHFVELTGRVPATGVGLELVFCKDGRVSPEGVGIFGSVELIRFSTAAISGITVTERLTDGEFKVDIALGILGSADNVRAVATLVSGSGQIYYGGLTGLVGTITVKDPLYWWPKGLGIQNLYKLTVNLYGEMEIEDTVEVKIGLRSFSPSRSANASLAEVNGEAFLPMGAVYLPEMRRDPIAARRRESAFLTAAARAGFNTLVIPADAPMPTEAFFSDCDAYGISVILGVDLDRDPDRRIARLGGVYYHPSLGMLDLIGVDEKAVDALPAKLKYKAPNLAFLHTGGGFSYPSYPSLPTERSLSDWLSEEERNVYSEKVEAGREELVRDMISSAARSYLYPYSLSDLAYVTGIDAASKVKEYITATRTARGTLGRAVFSRLGDAEFAVSDSSVDAFARWKATQYAAGRAFAPVILRAEDKGEGYVSFSVSNERRQGFVGSVEYRIIDNKNRIVYTETAPCEVERSTAKLLFSRDLGKHIKGHEREYYLEYLLRDPTGVHTRDVLMFALPKRFEFLDPNIKAEITGSDRRYSITLSATAFASEVEISFDEAEVVLSDNYFDITSPAPVKITFAVLGGGETAQHLMRTMKIRSLYDLKRPRESC